MSRRIIRHDDIYNPIKQSESQKTEEELHEEAYINNEHPDAIGSGMATLWYIIVMLVGAVFNDRWLIWIVTTVIWWSYINRKKRRKKEWDKMQKEKKNGGHK